MMRWERRWIIYIRLIFKFMSKSNKFLIIVGSLLAAFLFVWFQLRPTAIISKCANDNRITGTGRLSELQENNYITCLRIYGLNK